jgi:hypothetical protein
MSKSESPSEIYRFMSSEGCIKSILNRSLRISNIAKLNDPYDMMLGVSALPPGYEEKVDTLKAALHMREIMSQQAGVICFSARFSDPVMWAHYAANHSGMCLVFDATVLPDGVLKKVRYTKERPTVSYGCLHSVAEGEEGNELYQEAFFDALVAKSDSWSYEEEYRIILLITDKSSYNGVFGLPKGFLKRVIVGFNCDYSPSNVRSILNSSGYSDVPIQVARLSQEKFEVEVFEYRRVDMGDITPDQTDLIKEKLDEAIQDYLSSIEPSGEGGKN